MLAKFFSIRRKLLLLPAFASLGLLATMAFSYLGATEMSMTSERVVAQQAEILAKGQKLEVTILRLDTIVRAAPAEFDAARIDEFEAELTELFETLRTALINPTKDVSVGGAPEAAISATREAAEKVIGFARQFAQKQAVETIEGPFSEGLEALRDEVKLFLEEGEKGIRALVSDLARAKRRMSLTIAVTGVICLVTMIGMSLMIANRLNRRLAWLIDRTGALSEGDTAKPKVLDKGFDELRIMSDALEGFRLSMIEKDELEMRQKEAAERERRAEQEAAEEKRAQAEAERAREIAAERERRESEAEREALVEAANQERKEQLERQTAVVSALSGALNKLAHGQLDVMIDGEFEGEYERLRIDFNSAVAKLRESIETIQSSGVEINQACGEVADSAQAISLRGERTAANLEEAAAAIDQLTASVSSTEQNCKESVKVASSTTEATRAGQSKVNALEVAMNEIREASGQITRVTDLIESIAFQTNLLALNAGVEAARAGDAGRGFSVVASEVRALASRSAEAVTEITDQIQTSSESIERGIVLMADTQSALDGIAEFVTKIENRVASISESASEQASSLAEINQAISKVGEASQADAVHLQEATSATLSLKEQAKSLGEVTARFQISTELASSRSDDARDKSNLSTQRSNGMAAIA